MNQSTQRLTVGFTLVAAGVVVAVAGYLGVSRETEVAFQLPYFASAAVGALMLLGAGAAVLLSAQLGRDTQRLTEVEEAVRALAAEVGRLADTVEPPGARRRPAVPRAGAEVEATGEVPNGDGPRRGGRSPVRSGRR